MTRYMTPLLTAFLLAGCTGTEAGSGAAASGEGGAERVEAWQTVESYKIDDRVNITRASQWLRRPGNETKTREDAEAALDLRQLDPGPAVDAAMRIARADPTDDLGSNACF